MDEYLKALLFRATTETIKLYGSQGWALTAAEERDLNGTYTRMLRKVKNIGWQDKITNVKLYGNLTPIVETIRERRLRLAGHVHRDHSFPAQKTILWQPRHESVATLVDKLLKDTNLKNTTDLDACMMNRTVWKQIVEPVATASIGSKK